MTALGFGQVQGEQIVVNAQQLGHLTDQLVLYTLRRELVGLDIKLRQHLQKEAVEVQRQGAAFGIVLPRAFAGFAHDRQPLDLVAAEAPV